MHITYFHDFNTGNRVLVQVVQVVQVFNHLTFTEGQSANPDKKGR